MTRNEWIAETVVRLIVAAIGSGNSFSPLEVLKLVRDLSAELENQGCAPWQT